jgi:hypothetical protein
MAGRAVILILATLCVQQALPQQVPAAASDRLQNWREDLEYFAAQLARNQKDFSKLYPKDRFTESLTSLEADVARIPDNEVVVRLMRIVASANVGHNILYLPRLGNGFLNRLPLTFEWFPDGLGITAASSEYAAAIGTKVLQFGAMNPDQLLAAFAPYIPHENDVWLKQLFPDYAASAAMLRGLGLLSPEHNVISLRLVRPGGEPFSLEVAPGDPRIKQLSFSDALNVPAPLFLSHTGDDYWHRYLDDSRTLYIQYNNCRNDPAKPFDQFARTVLADMDARDVGRVVIDLRLNPGGNSTVIDPLMSGLKSRLKGRRVYVLVGSETFSSGLLNALQLRHNLHATLAGGEGGENLDSYGEARTIVLPHSKLTVQYTTRYYSMSGYAGMPKDALKPDLPVERTLADALAGRDPVLETVFRH